MEYPYLKCLEPKRLINPHTHKHILAPCGKCAACLTNKSNQRTLKCKLESNYNKYCYFITLTYAEDYVPNIKLIKHGEEYLGILNSRNLPIRTNVGTITYKLADELYIGKFKTSLSEYLKITSRTTNEKLNILYKPDVQLFMKRLRKQISKDYKNEKIRYYITGEYGPTTYRPHFHILLWFENKTLSENLGKYLSSCWLYGRISSEQALNAASYVASYVNSTCNLPPILTSKYIKQFSLHSQFLGAKAFETEDEILSETHALEFARRRVNLCGTPTDVNSWRSINNSRYPKCRKYATLDSCRSYDLYTLARKAKTAYPNSSNFSELRDNILNDVYNISNLYKSNDNSIQFHSRLACVDYYTNYISAYQLVSEQERKTYSRTLYLDLLTSNKFLKNINYDDNKVSSYINKIHLFYSELEYDYLKRQIQSTDDIIKYTGCIDDINYLYSNIIGSHNVQESPLYAPFRTKSIKYLNDSVKHKKQNDNNNLLKN